MPITQNAVLHFKCLVLLIQHKMESKAIRMVQSEPTSLVNESQNILFVGVEPSGCHARHTYSNQAFITKMRQDSMQH